MHQSQLLRLAGLAGKLDYTFRDLSNVYEIYSILHEKNLNGTQGRVHMRVVTRMWGKCSCQVRSAEISLAVQSAELPAAIPTLLFYPARHHPVNHLFAI